MPIFEYECSACGRVFEELTLRQVELTCPDCGSVPRRIVSASSPLTGKERGELPDARGHGCCGDRPKDKGCVPGSCCGRATT